MEETKHEFRSKIKNTIIRFSERGLPLIYTGPLFDNHILTAELYVKWYKLYLIKSDGTIESVDPALEDNEVEYRDNVWEPLSLRKWCDKNNIEMDELFYEILVGRWETEIKENY